MATSHGEGGEPFGEVVGLCSARRLSRPLARTRYAWIERHPLSRVQLIGIRNCAGYFRCGCRGTSSDIDWIVGLGTAPVASRAIRVAALHNSFAVEDSATRPRVLALASSNRLDGVARMLTPGSFYADARNCGGSRRQANPEQRSRGHGML